MGIYSHVKYSGTCTAHLPKVEEVATSHYFLIKMYATRHVPAVYSDYIFFLFQKVLYQLFFLFVVPWGTLSWLTATETGST